MKALALLTFLSFSAFAQDPNTYLKNFDAKVYSLKTKGVKDFVVDIQSDKLTKQLKDQQIFGKVDQVIFRTYWTLQPERLAIEVIGLPEGFREVKESLKASMLGVIDNLIPLSFAQRFPGYKFVQGANAKEFIAQDTTKIAAISSYTIKFDAQDNFVELVGNKPIGTLVIKPEYSKESFADGKWVLTEQTSVSSENGQTITVKKELDYGKAEGISVLEELEITTEQKVANKKSAEVSETITFKNYKINTGDALKHFLGDQKEAPKKTP